MKATIKVAKIMAMKTIDATMRTNIERREREIRVSVNTSFGVFQKRNCIFGGIGLFFSFFLPGANMVLICLPGPIKKDVL